MAETYCATTDLLKFFGSIDDYDLKRDLPEEDFVQHAGDVYRLDNSGGIAVLYRKRKDLGAAQATLVAVDTTDEWFYDTTTDTLYLQVANGTTPEDASNGRLQRSPQSWADAKTAAVQYASEWLESLLDLRFPRPLPKTDASKTSGEQYDFTIRQITALLACLHLINSTAPGSDDADLIQNQLWNEEETGLLDRLNSGKLKLSFEITRSDGVEIKESALDATTTGYPTEPLGGSAEMYEAYTVTIGTGGTLAIGTENTTITYSVDDSEGNSVIDTEYITIAYQDFGGGVQARWVPGLYVADDVWTMTVQGIGPSTSPFMTIDMVRK